MSTTDGFSITPVDKEKEEGGVWTTYFGVELLIGRANTDAFRKLFSKLSRPFLTQRGIESYEQIPQQDQIDIMVETISKTLLLDWKKTKRFNHDFSVETAARMLEVDPDCRVFISEFANNLANYYSDEEEAIQEKQ